jgi:hypothetical protein
MSWNTNSLRSGKRRSIRDSCKVGVHFCSMLIQTPSSSQQHLVHIPTVPTSIWRNPSKTGHTANTRTGGTRGDEATNTADLWTHAIKCICKWFVNPTPPNNTSTCYWPLLTLEVLLLIIIIILILIPDVTCCHYLFAVCISIWFVHGRFFFCCLYWLCNWPRGFRAGILITKNWMMMMMINCCCCWNSGSSLTTRTRDTRGNELFLRILLRTLKQNLQLRREHLSQFCYYLMATPNILGCSECFLELSMLLSLPTAKSGRHVVLPSSYASSWTSQVIHWILLPSTLQHRDRDVNQ